MGARMVEAIILWLRGWRWDMDGWLVRARKADDPVRTIRAIHGIVEECAVAVRTREDARLVDKNAGAP